MAVVAQGYEEFEALLVSIIASHTQRVETLNLTPQQIAHMMTIAARGFKEGRKMSRS